VGSVGPECLYKMWVYCIVVIWVWIVFILLMLVYGLG